MDPPSALVKFCIQVGGTHYSTFCPNALHIEILSLDDDIGTTAPDLARHFRIPTPAQYPLPRLNVHRHAQGILNRELGLMLVGIIGAGRDTWQRILKQVQ